MKKPLSKFLTIRTAAGLLLLCILVVMGPDCYVLHQGGKYLDPELSGRTASDVGNTAAEQPAVSGETTAAAVPAADCILVLGAGVYADGTPTPMLQDRLDRGIELYHRGAAGKLLLSGDNGQVEYNEVEVMKNYALQAGVPEEDIFLDHAGFSTYESMFRAGAVFRVQSAIVVTQRYHEYRALYIGSRLGLTVTGASAAETGYRGDTLRELREILARDKDFAKCLYKPDPTFLGEEIDIRGDGRVSW